MEASATLKTIGVGLVGYGLEADSHHGCKSVPMLYEPAPAIAKLVADQKGNIRRLALEQAGMSSHTTIGDA
jgi:hypothetical protein